MNQGVPEDTARGDKAFPAGARWSGYTKRPKGRCLGVLARRSAAMAVFDRKHIKAQRDRARWTIQDLHTAHHSRSTRHTLHYVPIPPSQKPLPLRPCDQLARGGDQLREG